MTDLDHAVRVPLEHDRVRLEGRLFLPDGVGPAPGVLVMPSATVTVALLGA